MQVNDGAALLFQIKSLLFKNFSDMYKLFEKHLYSKYGYCYVVFDCCENGPSTKDIQHKNRSKKVFLDITFTPDKKCIKSQDEFLDNQNSKTRFIAGLSNHLSENDFECVEDADSKYHS